MTKNKYFTSNYGIDTHEYSVQHINTQSEALCIQHIHCHSLAKKLFIQHLPQSTECGKNLSVPLFVYMHIYAYIH